MKKIFLYLFVFCILLTSCVGKGHPKKTANDYTMEELVVIEFATHMEEQEHRYQDYQRPENKE